MTIFQNPCEGQPTFLKKAYKNCVHWAYASNARALATFGRRFSLSVHSTLVKVGDLYIRGGLYILCSFYTN